MIYLIRSTQSGKQLTLVFTENSSGSVVIRASASLPVLTRAFVMAVLNNQPLVVGPEARRLSG